MELLRNDGLSWVYLKLRGGEVEQRRKNLLPRPGNHRVAEADVDLDRDASNAESDSQMDANALVLEILPYSLPLHTVRVKDETVVIDLDLADFAKHLDQARRIDRSPTE